MKWSKIDKSQRRKTARSGTYKDWKPELAVEGGHRCVYCAIPDQKFGGIYNFHVEHFEPKSKAEHRTNDWDNLYYSCSICNVFKNNDWPAPGSARAYLNPSVVDYEEHFIRAADGTLSGICGNSRYMVERIYLNRPQLRFERREASLYERYKTVSEKIGGLPQMLRDSNIDYAVMLDILNRAIELASSATSASNHLREVVPYLTADVRRPSNRLP